MPNQINMIYIGRRSFLESRVNRRKFGNTGLNVSEVSFGAMNLRLLETEQLAYDILNYVLDEGINLIDTARAYKGVNGEGKEVESEVLVGNAIRQRTDLDEPIVIVTKGHGYTLDALKEDLTTSREKLGITGNHDLYIGKNQVKLVYFFHGINTERWTSIKESGVLDKMQELKAEGLINYIGFSAHYGDTVEIREAVETGVFDVCELPYNVFNRSLCEEKDDDILKYVADNGLAIVNMKAFGGNGLVPIMKSLQETISIDYSTMLNFCLSNPYISTVDAGARYIKEFELDIEASLQPRFTAEEIEKLTAEADKIGKHMHHICRECMHCLEKFSCPQDINFPEILGLYGRYTISEKLEHDLTGYKEKYQNFSPEATECIECGECIPWCEYKINIPEMLQDAHAALSK